MKIIKKLTFYFHKLMEMLALRNEDDIKVNFNRDINFNTFYKPYHVTTTTEEDEECIGLKVALSCKYLISQNNSDTEDEAEDLVLLDEQSHTTVLLPKKPEVVMLFSSSALADADRDLAATKLQKVYKSYRIRRYLADLAVVCEELWWKDSDSSAFQRCLISHFDSDKSETAISKWATARTIAAKMGRGLSKDDKGQRLARKHWLEAIDPRHRYGHNLHFYYDVWFQCQSSEPFFYWLDIGDGKRVDIDKCARKKLQRQCIKYLGPIEREAYEVTVEGGKLVYKQSKNFVHTTEGSKWIFVLSSSRVLYVGQKEKGKFQHSSFVAGAATIASGRIIALNGVLHVIWPYSGHYRPTEKNLMEFVHFLEEHHVDMTNVKKHPVDDDIPPPLKPVDEELHIEHIENVEINKALSSKWTTGVAPRIGYVREYPSKHQLQALEELNPTPKANYGIFEDKTILLSHRLENMEPI
ncbi:IQ domain-containing protein IQM2-like [Vicia villosa]|uniref:IQ domain-containing protein IQM2-like n=1 Tax=Vicia villosa TaxID=3911 RepID=UPI00273B951A|nr:IQ domain-containing protein IQM2-like [Vicia villosa]